MSEQPKRKYRKNRQSWGRVRQLKSGRFQASYTAPDGAIYNAPHTFPGRTEANAWLATVRATITAEKWKSPKQIQSETFKAYATAYIEQRRMRTGDALGPKTKELYRWYLEVPLAEFADVPLADFTPAMVRTWHAKRASETATSAAREVTFMHGVFEKAVREDELIDRLPVPAELMHSKTGKKTRIPTPDELAVMIEYFTTNKPHLALWLYIAAYGGARRGELTALRRRDLVRLETEEYGDLFEVRLARQAQKLAKGPWIVKGTKWHSNRDPVLPAFLTPIIDAHLSTYVGKFPDSLVFPPNGPSDFIGESTIYRPFERARKAAKIDPADGAVRLHDFRGWHLTEYAKTGATTKEVQDRGGHSTMAAAEAYQHVTGRDLDLAQRLPQLPTAPKLPADLRGERKTRKAKKSA